MTQFSESDRMMISRACFLLHIFGDVRSVVVVVETASRIVVLKILHSNLRSVGKENIWVWCQRGRLSVQVVSAQALDRGSKLSVHDWATQRGKLITKQRVGPSNPA